MEELQEVEIKKISVFSFAGFFSVIGLLIGIILAILIVSGLSIAVSFFPGISTYVSKYVPGNASLIGAISLTFLVLGFVIGIFSAVIYNLMAKISGIKLYS